MWYKEMAVVDSNISTMVHNISIMWVYIWNINKQILFQFFKNIYVYIHSEIEEKEQFYDYE